MFVMRQTKKIIILFEKFLFDEITRYHNNVKNEERIEQKGKQKVLKKTQPLNTIISTFASNSRAVLVTDE